MQHDQRVRRFVDHVGRHHQHETHGQPPTTAGAEPAQEDQHRERVQIVTIWVIPA